MLNLKQADATLLGTLAWYEHFIIPKNIYENVEDWSTCEAATSMPIGTGPYKFVSYQSGVSVVAGERTRTISRAQPKIDKLVFQIITDDTRGAGLLQW